MNAFCMNSLFLLIGFFGCSFADTYVPVISWGNLDSKYPLVHAGHETTTNEFSLHYLEQLLSREKLTIFIFLQNKLSLHDFTLHADVYNENSDGGSYKNLKRILDTDQNFVLPSVDDPMKAINDFKKSFQGKIYTLGSPYIVDNIIAEGDSNLVFVPLPKFQGKNIKRIDTIIGKITDDMMKANTPFIALYTANAASKVPSTSFHHARNLLAVNDATNGTDITVISKCALFYATSIQFGFSTGSKYTYTVLPNSYQSSSNCSMDNSGIVTIDFKDLSGSLSAFSLTIDTFLRPDDYWHMRTSATWTYDDQTSSDHYISGSVWAPRGYSYHCTRTSFRVLLEDLTLGVAKTQIKIAGLQVELGDFDITEPEFGYPNDCDGYFSIGSLLALFVGFILALIFAFGITMLSSINTMDRFDDPKGKTIVVNVND